MSEYETEQKRKQELLQGGVYHMPEMTDKEQLYQKFFADTVTLVQDMDDAALRAHIEELGNIAFEARTRLVAADSIARKRAFDKKKALKVTVPNNDDFTSDAINNINDRQKKMTKVEKEIERLVNMGVAREDAVNMYKAATINTIKKQGVAAVIADNSRIKTIVDSVVNASEEKKCPECGFQFDSKAKGIKECPECKSSVDIPKKFVNPFASKEEVTSNSGTPAKVLVMPVIEPEPLPALVKPTFVNPFAKKESHE